MFNFTFKAELARQKTSLENNQATLNDRISIWI